MKIETTNEFGDGVTLNSTDDKPCPNYDARCYLVHLFAGSSNPLANAIEPGEPYTMEQVAKRHGNLVWGAILAVDADGLWLLAGSNGVDATADDWLLLQASK